MRLECLSFEAKIGVNELALSGYAGRATEIVGVSETVYG
jgi:hypothetical protein